MRKDVQLEGRSKEEEKGKVLKIWIIACQPPKEVEDAQLLVDRFSSSEPTSCDADGVYM